MAEPERIDISAQKGPQTAFLSSPADIAIYGGQAGGGKTWALLMEPLRHIHVKGFGAVIFRRTSPQIRNEGGLWDESGKLYPLLGARPNSMLEWIFPKGCRIKMAHMQYESDRLDWQGSQIPLICWDELTHFTRLQFFYLMSRNRSMCGVKPYIRATCNPDADSWVAELIDWWIGDDGYPIAERGGVLRWFVHINDQIIWADSAEELRNNYPDSEPKSLTFIPASIHDNRALLDADPGYLANLKALPAVEQERLLYGNWKIRPAAGLYFQRSQVEMIDAEPAGLRVVRYWDLAATEKTQANDPDWTVGLKMGTDAQGYLYILDVIRMRSRPGTVETALMNTASQDGKTVIVGIPQDPGQAGKSQAQYFARQLRGYTIRSNRETGDKITRFSPFSAQVQAGNVKVLRGPWNEAYFSSLEGFPEALHDDDVDATSGAFELILNSRGPMRISESTVMRAAQ